MSNLPFDADAASALEMAFDNEQLTGLLRLPRVARVFGSAPCEWAEFHGVVVGHPRPSATKILIATRILNWHRSNCSTDWELDVISSRPMPRRSAKVELTC